MNFFTTWMFNEIVKDSLINTNGNFEIVFTTDMLSNLFIYIHIT